MPEPVARHPLEVSDTVGDILDKIEVSDLMEDMMLSVLSGASAEDRAKEISTEHAFDYDGCIGNNQGEKKSPEELVAAEAGFWAYVKREMHAETKGLPNDRRCVSIATARQSQWSDKYSSIYNNSTSCFALYPYLADYLDAQDDRFLLSDVKGGLDSGTSFERAMDSDYEGLHEDWHFDESKISLIYAKTHRSAIFNAEGLALFTFYDDRTDILDAVHLFYTQSSHLLPHNLVLNLCRRERGDDAVYKYPPIFGINNKDSLGIDYNYKETVNKIGAHIASFSKQALVYDAVTQKDVLSMKPINISEILQLGLGEMIYHLRTAPENIQDKTEERIKEEQVSLGSMIFEDPDSVQDARADAACGADKMFASGYSY